MKAKLRRAGILLSVLISFVTAKAGGDFGVSVYHSRGVFWAHRKTILNLEKPTRGLDVNFTFFTHNSSKEWPARYRHPRIGLTLSYLDMGTPSIMGSAFGVLPFMEVRILQKKHHELSFRWATGLGYITKVWDLETNNGNRVIGSHFNANMRGHLMYHALLPKGFELSLSAGITHYSNGNIKLPNLGVNCVEMAVGIGFNRMTPSKATVPAKAVSEKPMPRKAWELRYSMGSKETSIIYRKRIFPATFSTRYFFRMATWSRWHSGIDFFFDQGRLYRDNPADVTERPNLGNSLDIGVHVGHELLLGRLHFVTELGIYAYSPGLFKGISYQRLGFKYSFHPQWNASVVLKTHFSRADLFEWGIGYTIFR